MVADKGYTQVMTFKGGIPEWVKAGFSLDETGLLGNEKIPTISVDELNAKIEQVKIVDIRSSQLYEMGWIPGSIRIPLGKLSAEYAAIPQGKPIVVVDHFGKQVLAAGRYLKMKGFDNVMRLQGGVMAWVTKGYTLEK